MKALTAAFFVACAGTAAHGQQQIVVGPNVQVSKAKSDREHSEVIIAADPNDARHLLAGSMVFNPSVGGYDVVTYVSFDAGKEWKPTLDVRTEFGFAGDPSTAFGCDGSAYSVNLVITSAKLDGRRIRVHRSKDGGRTWLPPTLLRWSDREYITVDCTKSKYRGRVYIIAQGDMGAADGRRVTGTRMFVSGDSGKTFVEWNLPPAADRQASFQGPPVVLSDGTFLGPIFDNPADRSKRGTTFRVIHSETGGTSFAGSYMVAELGVPAGGFPALAVDPGSGPYRDRVYALWEAPLSPESKRAGIYVAYSADKGKTWLAPVLVSEGRADANGRGGFDAYMGAIAVNRDGVVGVSWYDRFDSTKTLDWTVRFAASFDGGATFTRGVEVTEAPFLHESHKAPPISLISFGGGSILTVSAGSILTVGTGPAIEIRVPDNRSFNRGGDTAGLVADAAGVFHPVWVDNRTGVAQVWTAPVRANLLVARQAGATGSGNKVSGLEDTTANRNAAERGGGDTVDITKDIMMTIRDVRSDLTTNTIFGVMYLINTSDMPLTGPIAVSVVSVDGAGVEIVNAENRQRGKGASWDFTSLLRGNRLQPGAWTGGKRIEFLVPDVRARDQLPRITVRVLRGASASRPADSRNASPRLESQASRTSDSDSRYRRARPML